MLYNASPFLVAASTFTAFLWADESNVLTPEIAFVSLTLFNQLRTPMSSVAELISQTVQVYVSNQRLKEYLVAKLVVEDEQKALQTTDAFGSSFPRRSFLPPVSADIVDVRDATVTWGREDPSIVISDLNLTVSRGQLIAVIGRVGAGKSSLLQAILGEMECLRGRIQVNGSVAYLSQQPWMMNDSVRANIIFGQRYDEVFYNRVMDACCLYSDMSMSALGDMTEIGEKGINLSDGQKACISLARGVYQNRDVYLLDDLLSAVDAHVGKQLFTNVIGPEGILRNKTRILVTHELSYLKYADSIVIMADGAIKNEGSYAELSRTGALTQLIKECSEEKEAAAAVEVDEDEYFNSVDDDHHSDDLFEDDPNSVDLMLGTSMMFTVSGIIARRRPSVGTRILKRRRHSTARESVVSTEASGRQLTGVERVETGRVKARVYLAYFQAMGNCVMLFAALFATVTRETTSAGVLGLSVSYAVNITFVLNFAVRQISKLETNIVAVERVNGYAEVEAEADWVVENNRPMIGWPQLSAVEFKCYSTRYRPGLELVVKHINARIGPGQRSSLTLALFRLIEPAEDAIVIGGVDIATIGLHDLRSRLTIIPQDPCLFSGSLRFNLDPFGRHSDHELWQALEMAHLKRQLLCLARALLRRSTILVLDEANASAELATDVLIQQTLRREFVCCAVLTFVHRLHTIADYDLGLVLDGGVVREFDALACLLANPHSLYASMVANAQEPNGTSTNL
ncbi:Mrp-4 [Aphelenchoides fujianensis]|nr:Mrp-4 [Aphelenchoides fujianensis]